MLGWLAKVLGLAIRVLLLIKETYVAKSFLLKSRMTPAEQPSPRGFARIVFVPSEISKLSQYSSRFFGKLFIGNNTCGATLTPRIFEFLTFSFVLHLSMQSSEAALPGPLYFIFLFSKIFWIVPFSPIPPCSPRKI